MVSVCNFKPSSLQDIFYSINNGHTEGKIDDMLCPPSVSGFPSDLFLAVFLLQKNQDTDIKSKET